jgi:hypothetical protein
MVGINERRRYIEFWCGEFGSRARCTIKPWEIHAVRDRWLLQGPKSVVRKDTRVQVAEPISAS